MHMKWRQFGAHAPLFPLPDGFEVEFSKKTDPEDGMPLYEQLLFVDGKLLWKQVQFLCQRRGGNRCLMK